MLKIKQQNSNLVITNMGEASVVDISTLENAKKAIGMLTKAYEQVYFANQALKENVEATESYSIKGIEPLFADTFTNVPDTVTKAAKESLKFTPPLLQGLAVEKQAQLVMAVYNQLGNSLLQNSGVDRAEPRKHWLLGLNISLETLDLRMKAQSSNALALAQWLEKQAGVEKVFHPGLKSHPQHALAKRQQKAGGPIVSFVLKGGKKAAYQLINKTRLCSITANLGDTRTTITHPATTTHCRITPQARKEAGIVDGLVRIAVGLENIEDLKNDLQAGLKK
jgi:O-acetylhomoserine/O-acetylserine sulfhydrylase-like pyridoxal-dependent enzyme